MQPGCKASGWGGRQGPLETRKKTQHDEGEELGLNGKHILTLSNIFEMQVTQLHTSSTYSTSTSYCSYPEKPKLHNNMSLHNFKGCICENAVYDRMSRK